METSRAVAAAAASARCLSAFACSAESAALTRIRGFVYAAGGDAAAVAIDTEGCRRFLVIFLFIDGHWVAPSLLNSSSIDSARPTSTQPPNNIADLSAAQTAPPGPERPAIAWMACAGTAAKDALFVEVTSLTDSAQVAVGEDGFFLALITAGWAERLQLFVHTKPGERIPVRP